MKLQYCSDLHLEFSVNKDFLKAKPIKPSANILLLAGDIVPFAQLDKHNDFFNFVSDNFQFTYWLPGNHEYYDSDVYLRSGSMNEAIRDNVFLVNNFSVQLQHVNLVFSTFWSAISPLNEWQIETGLSDFQVIRYNGKKFSAHQYNRLHEAGKHFLEEQLHKNTTGKTVVITHHIPTFLHYPKQFRFDVLNEAFASEQFNFIESSGFDYWIFGHHHINVPAFTIGKTTLLTNQLGYVQYGEHFLFNPDKTITV